MSIALVVTAGFGNDTLNGTIGDVVTRGFTIGTVIITPDSTIGVFGAIDSDGVAVKGGINVANFGVSGDMFDTFGVSGTIDDSNTAVKGKIDPSGLGVKGEI